MSPLTVPRPVSTCDDVVDVTGMGLGDFGKHVGGGVDAVHDEHIARSQQHVPDQFEDPVPADVAQVHAGDADYGEHGHEHLQLLADVDISRGDDGRIQLGMADLTPMRIATGSDRGDACGAGESVVCDGHLRLLDPAAGAAGAARWRSSSQSPLRLGLWQELSMEQWLESP